jgi:hypothetical protein
MPNWYTFRSFALFYGNLVYFVVFGYNFGNFVKKNLATSHGGQIKANLAQTKNDLKWFGNLHLMFTKVTFFVTA